MKKKMSVCLILVLFVWLMPVVSARAIGWDEDEWFEVYVPKGPISVQVGNRVSLYVHIENFTLGSHYVEKLMVIVIDPFTGQRVLGPKNYFVQESIPGMGNIIVKISLGPFPASSENKTVGAVILAVDSGGICRGTGGWGFLVKP